MSGASGYDPAWEDAEPGRPRQKSQKREFQMDASYVEVNERIVEFREKYPDGRLTSEILQLPAAFADRFLAVRAYAHRTPDDPVPGSGMAWEPVPGLTPYTKNSELMNAETSAWGRAIIAALAADAKRSIASAQEVRNRQAEQKPKQQAPQSTKKKAPAAQSSAQPAEWAGAPQPEPAKAEPKQTDDPDDGEKTRLRALIRKQAEAKNRVDAIDWKALEEMSVDQLKEQMNAVAGK